MAKKPKIKVERTFDFGKLSRQLPKIIADGLNEKSKWINKGIQDGINEGKDLEGKPFVELTEFTKEKRKRKGTGKTILYESGKMSETKIKRATPAKLQVEIKSKAPYGAEHNKGDDSQNLPQRKWFGINKANRPGGKDHEKVNKFLAVKLHRAWRKRGI